MEGFLGPMIFLALLAWAIFTQIQARIQLNVTVPMSELEAAQVVIAHFGIVWAQVDGPGQLNFRSRMRMHAPTISISFEPDGPTKCNAAIWTSQWRSYFGIMAHASLMWRKKRSAARRLRRAAIPQEA